MVFKWWNRRSQRRSYNWTTFEDIWQTLGLPVPRIVETRIWPSTFCLSHDHPHILLHARFPDQPGAGIPHAGISEGASGNGRSHLNVR